MNYKSHMAIYAALVVIASGAHAAPLVKMQVMPPWAESSVAAPIDNWSIARAPSADATIFQDEFQSVGGGLPVGSSRSVPTAGVNVLLATGTLSYLPTPDMVMRNPTGSDAVFQRSYRSDCAKANIGSPGLPPGWVHNYDLKILTPPDAASWGPVALVYPSGAHESLTPVIGGDGSPTGEFQPSTLPYAAKGIPGTEPGKWKEITLQWKDRGDWTFRPSVTRPGVYPLFELCGLALSYDSSHRIQSISNIDTPKSALLTWRYDEAGYLQSITDITGRVVDYQTQVFDNKPCLTEVSIVYSHTEPKDVRPRYTFRYRAIDDHCMLTKITTPGSGGADRYIVAFDYDAGRVRRFTDPVGNYHEYTYGDGTTKVDVKNTDGTLALTWTQKWDSGGRNIGTIDALGRGDSIKY